MNLGRILVVEDELIVAQHLRRRLQGLGYDVPAVAAAGEEALELIGGVRPDLVLMDILLGGAMDGITTAGHIRRRYGTPVIYLTASLDPVTLQRARLTEPAGYIFKPFDVHELQLAIAMALRKHVMGDDS